MTPTEVAALFRVRSSTVQRWATAGHLPHVRTLGGHLRFPRQAVRALYAGLHPRIVALTDEQVAAATRVIQLVLDRDGCSQLSGEDAQPLRDLLAALRGSEQ